MKENLNKYLKNQQKMNNVKYQSILQKLLDLQITKKEIKDQNIIELI